MQALLLGGLVLAIILGLAASPLRDRVSLVRGPGRLELHPQQAAVRLDTMILLICVLGLLFAAMTRATIGLAGCAAAGGIAAWRIVAARRAPVFVFDLSNDAVWRGAQRICALSAIETLTIRPAGRTAFLELGYRDRNGRAVRQRLHSAPEPKLVALHASIADFLAANLLVTAAT